MPAPIHEMFLKNAENEVAEAIERVTKMGNTDEARAFVFRTLSESAASLLAHQRFVSLTEGS